MKSHPYSAQSPRISDGKPDATVQLPSRQGWSFFAPFAVGFGLTCLFMLSGCGVATLPVKATSKVVDWSTTSRDEADRNRGREIRKSEEEYDRCVRKGYSDC